MSNFYNNSSIHYRRTINTIERIKKKPYKSLIILFIIFIFIYLIISGVRNSKPKKVHPNHMSYSQSLNATFQTEVYAYRAVGDLKDYDVSIITQFTVDRFDRIAMMADKWRAPISAAVYIQSVKDIDEVFKLVRNSYAVSEFVDIHFLFANNTRYPVNSLRNLALRNARTEWVLLLDVDFVSPLGMYQNLHLALEKVESNRVKKISNIGDKQQQDESDQLKVSFVIPSFSSSLSRFDFPDDKKDLIQLINQGEIKQINTGVCPKCHGPTNYEKWYLANEPYEAEYRWIYEPFLLYNKSQIDNYDERLKGYGFDKNSHTFGMAANGFSFIVLPNVWIIHMNHKNKPWEGTDTFGEQMFDNLGIICSKILPESKLKNGYDPNKKLFNEPLKDNDNCLTIEHW